MLSYTYCLYIDPPPPPTDFQLVDVTPGRLTFNWSRVDSNCSTLQYNMIVSNCGVCACTTPVRDNFVICSIDLTSASLSGNGPSRFSVQSVICNNITGSISMLINATLRGELQSCHDCEIIILLCILYSIGATRNHSYCTHV